VERLAIIKSYDFLLEPLTIIKQGDDESWRIDNSGKVTEGENMAGEMTRVRL
jgi:hypothetical protein